MDYLKIIKDRNKLGLPITSDMLHNAKIELCELKSLLDELEHKESLKPCKGQLTLFEGVKEWQ